MLTVRAPGYTPTLSFCYTIQDDLRAAQQQIFTRLEKADTDANDGTSLLAMQTGLFRLLQGAAPVMILQRTFVD